MNQFNKKEYGKLLITGGHSRIKLTAAKPLTLRYGCYPILAGRYLERVEKSPEKVRAQKR